MPNMWVTCEIYTRDASHVHLGELHTTRVILTLHESRKTIATYILYTARMSLFTRSYCKITYSMRYIALCSGRRNQIFPSNSILFARLRRLKPTIPSSRPGTLNNIDRSNRGNNVSNHMHRQQLWQVRRWWLCIYAKGPLDLTLVAVSWTISISRGFQ